MKLCESKLYREDLDRAISFINLNKLDGKTVFITGGLGLIGSTIVDILLSYGKLKKVYVGARDYKKFEERFGKNMNASFVEYDALKELKINFVPDYIICGAGLASPELYVKKPVETILSNFNGVHKLLDFAKNNHINRLIYISSSEVYGKIMSSVPYCEKEYGVIDMDNIRSSYAEAKRASEMLCKAYCSEYNVDMIIVRPGHIYGPSAKKSDNRVSSLFAFKAAEGQKIELKSAGKQRRSYCYSVDCAIQILFTLLKGKKGEAYNIGHDEMISIREMAEMFAQIGGCEVTVTKAELLDSNCFNPMDNSVLDNRRVKELGYNDVFSSQQGMEHTVRILRGE